MNNQIVGAKRSPLTKAQGTHPFVGSQILLALPFLLRTKNSDILAPQAPIFSYSRCLKILHGLAPTLLGRQHIETGKLGDFLFVGFSHLHYIISWNRAGLRKIHNCFFLQEK